MILVTGGTGFVGSHVVRALRAEERPVRVLARRPEKHGRVRDWGCELVQGDVTDAESLRRAVAGCEAVIHLVALPPFSSPKAIERTMTHGTRDLVAAAQDAGVTRFVLMSALGASKETVGVSPYYAAKVAMEEAVAAAGLSHVVLRPSFIFGRDGGILAQQIRIARLSPVTPILSRHRMQPVWVDDVAAFFAGAISLEEAPNRIFDLAGPDRVTWGELHERIRRIFGKRRLTVTMPAALLKAGATVGSVLPPFRGAPDAISMLDHGDNVGDPEPANETFGIRPIGLDEQIRRAAA